MQQSPMTVEQALVKLLSCNYYTGRPNFLMASRMTNTGNPAPRSSSGNPAPRSSSGNPAPRSSSDNPAPRSSSGNPAPRSSSHHSGLLIHLLCKSLYSLHLRHTNSVHITVPHLNHQHLLPRLLNGPAEWQYNR